MVVCWLHILNCCYISIVLYYYHYIITSKEKWDWIVDRKVLHEFSCFFYCYVFTLVAVNMERAHSDLWDLELLLIQRHEGLPKTKTHMTTQPTTQHTPATTHHSPPTMVQTCIHTYIITYIITYHQPPWYPLCIGRVAESVAHKILVCFPSQRMPSWQVSHEPKKSWHAQGYVDHPQIIAMQ